MPAFMQEHVRILVTQEHAEEHIQLITDDIVGDSGYHREAAAAAAGKATLRLIQIEVTIYWLQKMFNDSSIAKNV